MYGIVNRAIEELVKEKFGELKWEDVKKRSGIDIDYFLSNEPYDDDVTYKLANAVSVEMNIPLNNVFREFGEWWVLRTGIENYGGLIKAGGDNLKAFLINLPGFHNRVMLYFTKLTPPEFKVSDIEERSLQLHYFSKREGLREFVHGLLVGLGKMYHSPVELVLLESRDTGSNHEIFKVSW
jgi:hypothetical protein